MSARSAPLQIDLEYFHAGLLVADLEAAMQELTHALGVTWNEPHESRYGSSRLRATYSREGPPFIELIEGDGPWTPRRASSEIDHLGYWSEDLERDKLHLQRAGLPIEIDGSEHGVDFTYHRAAKAGVRIELIGPVRGALLRHSIGMQAAHAPGSSDTTPPGTEDS